MQQVSIKIFLGFILIKKERRKREREEEEREVYIKKEKNIY